MIITPTIYADENLGVNEYGIMNPAINPQKIVSREISSECPERLKLDNSTDACCLKKFKFF